MFFLVEANNLDVDLTLYCVVGIFRHGRSVAPDRIFQNPSNFVLCGGDFFATDDRVAPDRIFQNPMKEKYFSGQEYRYGAC